jgi:hypothetical protein
VEGDLDCAARWAWTSRSARVRKIRVFDVDAPGAAPEDLAALEEKTERYCTVLQTLLSPPAIEADMRSPAAEAGRGSP